MLAICTHCGYEFELEPFIQVDTTTPTGKPFPVKLILTEHLRAKNPVIRIPRCGMCAPPGATGAEPTLKKKHRLKRKKSVAKPPKPRVWRPGDN